MLAAAAAVAASIGLGALFSGAGWLRADTEEPELPMQGAGVVVDWAPRAGAMTASGALRDFVLASDRLRLVLGNDGSGIERHQRFGAVLALGAVKNEPGELTELCNVLFVAGAPVPLRTLDVEVGRAGELPIPTVLESSRDGRFQLRTEYRLEAGRDFVEVTTQVTNVSGHAIRAVQLGERARFSGTPAFAPRLGHVHVPTQADVPWLGRAGPTTSYGFLFLDRPAQASFEFDVVGSVGETLLGALADLGPGASAALKRDVIVVAGGLGKVAELAWQRLGKQLGRARGVLRPVPGWATVSARHPDGKVVLSVPVERDGSFDLPLPPGEYRFVLQAPGGEDEATGWVAPGAELPLNLVPPRPGTLHFVITDDTSQPMPSRLVVRGVAPTKDPELLPVAGEAGAKNMLYSLTGSGSLELPPGRYQVQATRGPEYSLWREELELNAGLGVTFRAQLPRVVDTAGWLSADFHVHAAPSADANVPLDERVLTLAAEGVELAAATDHNHVTDYAGPIREQGLAARLASLPGVELTTPDWGHFNAYPYAASLELPSTHDTTPLEMFAVVRARAPEAVLQVNHPRMPGVGYFNRGELDTKTGVAQTPGFSFGFDTLEVANGFELEDPSVFERSFREWLELLNLGHRYTAVGNSDSHRVVYQWAGWPRTYLRVPDQFPGRVAASDVARALAGGHVTVSAGLFVLPIANGSAGPGDTVQGSRVSLAIGVGFPQWIDAARLEVYGNGAKLAERTREAGLTRRPWRVALDFELKADTALVVLARGDTFMHEALPGKWIKPFGFSNPIFVDANADGEFEAPGP